VLASTVEAASVWSPAGLGCPAPLRTQSDGRLLLKRVERTRPRQPISCGTCTHGFVSRIRSSRERAVCAEDVARLEASRSSRAVCVWSDWVIPRTCGCTTESYMSPGTRPAGTPWLGGWWKI